MAQPNQENPFFNKIELPGSVWITAGTAYDDTTIKAAIGTPGTDMAAGSIYISTHASTPGVWIAVTTTWTKLTVN
jgi:hypothetical protein